MEQKNISQKNVILLFFEKPFKVAQNSFLISWDLQN